MRIVTLVLLVLAFTFMFTACTDTALASIGAIGDAADVTCYSGGQVIFKGRSTGVVEATQNSDGWEFKDAATGKFVRISGTCVVVN